MRRLGFREGLENVPARVVDEHIGLLPGRRVWQRQALPKIYAYDDEVLADFSINDMTHALHYMLKMLQNMQRLDATGQSAEQDGEESDDAAEEANG